MTRQDAEPRASPAKVPEKLIDMINSAYDDDHEKALAIRMTIIEFVDYLNERGRYEDAVLFLEQEAATIASDAERRRKEKQRKRFVVFARAVFPAVVLAAAKALSAKYGWPI